ncbi:MAG: coiled-coil domain-containing protein, partial [Tuberibacillus sp.]
MGIKIPAKLAGLCVGGLLLTTPISASADTYSNLQHQKSSVTKQKQQVKSELDQLSKQVKDLTGQISTTQIEIGKIQDEVATLNKNITETQKRIEDRQDLLKERMVASYKNGGASINVLEVLMGSTSFGDFINRAVAVYNITDHDNSIIQKQIADQNLLKKQKDQVKQDLAKTQTKLQQLSKMVAKIQAIQSQKQTALNGLSSKESQLSSQLAKISAQHTTVSTLASASRSGSTHSGSSRSNNIEQMSYIPSAAASGSVSDIINASRRYIGHSTYDFGGMDPVHGRFDCSGFVNWAYSQIGINLGSRSTSGLQYVGHAVSKSELRPGDLVFFDTYKHNGHVAIYIGGGKFLGSLTSTGVAIVNL